MKSIKFNYYKILHICFYFCLFSLNTNGQNVCINQTLQRIINQIPDWPEDSTSTREIIFPAINKHRTIIVTRNANGIINHVGFKCFNRQIIAKQPTPIYHFLERYMLELSLLPNNQKIATRLKMDRIKITSEIHPLTTSFKDGLKSILSEDMSNLSIYITCNNNCYIVSLLKEEKHLLQITFPARYELITGFSKIEAESLFYHNLLLSLNEPCNPLNNLDLIPYKDSLYCTFEDSYIMNKVVSTAYYYKTGTNYRPVFSPAYPAESLYNLFNAQNHENNMMVSISQSIYGKNLDYEIPINQLTSFLRKQNCYIYTGLKETDGSTMSGTVMAVNTELGYQHLIIFSADKELLVHPDKHIIKAKMYCYIPIHNISALFEY